MGPKFPIRKYEGPGWKPLGRPKRETILTILDCLELIIDSLLELVPD